MLLKEVVDEKFIFVNKKGLREALCLLGSKHVKFVFGPSTGLLHAASGIYNVLCRQRRERSEQDIPLMIVYITKSTHPYNEFLWWEHSLVNSMHLRISDTNEKELIPLLDSDRDVATFYGRTLAAQDLTAVDVVNYLKEHYQADMKRVGLIR